MNETNTLALWCLLDMLFIGVPLWVMMFKFNQNRGGLRANA